MARRYKFNQSKSPKAPQPVKNHKPRINKTLVAIFVFLISAGLLGSTIIWSLPVGTGVAPGSQNIKALQDAVYKDPENATAKVALANALFDKQQFPEAIQQYENAIEKGLKEINVYGDLATAYFYTGNVDKAIENANIALEIDANYAPVNKNLAIFLGEGKGDLNGAIAQLEKFLEKNTDQQAEDMLKDYKARATTPQVLQPPTQQNK